MTGISNWFAAGFTVTTLFLGDKPAVGFLHQGSLLKLAVHQKNGDIPARKTDFTDITETERANM